MGKEEVKDGRDGGGECKWGNGICNETTSESFSLTCSPLPG